jgi:hypothetical protein
MNLAYCLCSFLGTISIVYVERGFRSIENFRSCRHGLFDHNIYNSLFDHNIHNILYSGVPPSYYEGKEFVGLNWDIGKKFFNVMRIIGQLYSNKWSDYQGFKGSYILSDAEVDTYKQTHVGRIALEQGSTCVVRCLNPNKIELRVGRQDFDENRDYLTELLNWLETTNWFFDTKEMLNRMLGVMKEFSEGNRSRESEISHILDL